MNVMSSVDKTDQQPTLLLIIEYHSYGAPVVDGAVQVADASVYLARGLSPDDVYGVSDMQKPGIQYVQIADRIQVQQAMELTASLSSEFLQRGIPVQTGSFYDE